jgi:hypothetical protein
VDSERLHELEEAVRHNSRAISQLQQADAGENGSKLAHEEQSKLKVLQTLEDDFLKADVFHKEVEKLVSRLVHAEEKLEANSRPREEVERLALRVGVAEKMIEATPRNQEEVEKLASRLYIAEKKIKANPRLREEEQKSPMRSARQLLGDTHTSPMSRSGRQALEDMQKRSREDSSPSARSGKQLFEEMRKEAISAATAAAEKVSASALEDTVLSLTSRQDLLTEAFARFSAGSQTDLQEDKAFEDVLINRGKDTEMMLSKMRQLEVHVEMSCQEVMGSLQIRIDRLSEQLTSVKASLGENGGGQGLNVQELLRVTADEVKLEKQERQQEVLHLRSVLESLEGIVSQLARTSDATLKSRSDLWKDDADSSQGSRARRASPPQVAISFESASRPHSAGIQPHAPLSARLRPQAFGSANSFAPLGGSTTSFASLSVPAASSSASLSIPSGAPSGLDATAGRHASHDSSSRMSSADAAKQRRQIAHTQQYHRTTSPQVGGSLSAPSQQFSLGPRCAPKLGQRQSSDHTAGVNQGAHVSPISSGVPSAIRPPVNRHVSPTSNRASAGRQVSTEKRNSSVSSVSSAHRSCDSSVLIPSNRTRSASPWPEQLGHPRAMPQNLGASPQATPQAGGMYRHV